MTSRCPGAMLLYIRLRESVTCVNSEWEEWGGGGCNVPAWVLCPRSDYSDILVGQL